jgi:hypothetical protein
MMNFKPFYLILPGLLALTGCSQTPTLPAEPIAGVTIDKLAADEFVLTISRNEPPMAFENRRLRLQSEQLCPTGYSYVLRQAHKHGQLAVHHAECAAGANCSHELRWHIRCGHVPREPFRFFGRT